MRGLGTVALWASAALFAAFFLNVSYGAFVGAPFLSDVAEMLMLLASAAVFVVCVLVREYERDASSD